MRLAYITSFFPPERVAGAELGTRFMARHFAARGHEVHVLVSRPVSRLGRREEREGYTVHWLPWLGAPGLRLLSELRATGRLLAGLRPDIVHGNCLLPGGLAAARAGRRLGVPSVTLCYGYDVADISPLQALLFGRPALRGSTRVLAATRHAAGVVERLCPGLGPRVFLAGCDAAAFPLAPFRPAAPPRRLLFTGRLIPEKGVELLPDILRLLPADFRLEIVGRGPLEADLRRAAGAPDLAGRVEFAGMVDNSLLGERFRRADALLLPSRREPFGVVAIEAACSGLPVVASRVMGLPEAVADGRSGILVDGRDPRDWAAAVLRATGDDFRRRAHEAAGADRSRWDWGARLEELEGIYRELLAGMRRA